MSVGITSRRDPGHIENASQPAVHDTFSIAGRSVAKRPLQRHANSIAETDKINLTLVTIPAGYSER